MTHALLRSLLLLALCAPVAGCLTSAERSAARDNDRCVARGYKPDTKDFNDCMTRIETERGLRMQTRNQELLEKSAAPAFNDGSGR